MVERPRKLLNITRRARKTKKHYDYYKKKIITIRPDGVRIYRKKASAKPFTTFAPTVFSKHILKVLSRYRRRKAHPMYLLSKNKRLPEMRGFHNPSWSPVPRITRLKIIEETLHPFYCIDQFDLAMGFFYMFYMARNPLSTSFNKIDRSTDPVYWNIKRKLNLRFDHELLVLININFEDIVSEVIQLCASGVKYGLVYPEHIDHLLGAMTINYVAFFVWYVRKNRDSFIGADLNYDREHFDEVDDYNNREYIETTPLMLDLLSNSFKIEGKTEGGAHKIRDPQPPLTGKDLSFMGKNWKELGDSLSPLCLRTGVL